MSNVTNFVPKFPIAVRGITYFLSSACATNRRVDIQYSADPPRGSGVDSLA
jgi:hypothetical protein